MTQIILWFCIYWTTVSVLLGVWAVVWSLTHPRMPRKTPKPPTPPTLPTKPFEGRLVLPDVGCKPYVSPQQAFLNRWRAEQSLVAHPEIGDSYRSIVLLDDYRRVSAN